MKIALITGGSRGLGRSMCLRLAARGHDVILTYRERREAAEAVARLIEGEGRKAFVLPLDVAEHQSFAAFAQHLREALQRGWAREDFDFLVNNAGLGAQASFMETREEQFDAMMNVHLKGPYFLTQALLPLMKDGGRIVNVSSGLARFSQPGYSAYAVMKGGVEVMTRYLAKELGPRRIAVNTIAPGAIATDFGGGRVRDDQEMNRMIASGTALGRVGEAEDIGGAVACLLDSENGWVNGQRIEVSGGVFL